MATRAQQNPAQQNPAFDAACDVIVVGAGAAGLATAVTAAFHGLSVIVAEKEPLIGGTSAWSGGWMWVPRNPLATRAGIVESPDEPLRYLASEIGPRASDPRVAAFLDNGPPMIAFFETHTSVRFVDGNAVPDFHASEGTANGGRSVCAAPYDARELGEWAARLRPPLDTVSLWGMGIAAGADLNHFMRATRVPRSALHVLRRLARHLRDILVHGRGTQLVNGNALVARLLRSALDLGVHIRTNAPVTRLLTAEGRILGAVMTQDGKPWRIRAHKGVVLAAGGYPHDRERVARTFPHAGSEDWHHSAAPEANTGDGLRLGEAAGGVVAEDVASPGAWSPVSLVPQGRGRPKRFPHLIGRARPGCIIVDRHGRRFCNEADSYHDVGAALLAHTPQGEQPVAWMICDHSAQRRFGLGWSKPFPFPTGGAIRAGYMKTGTTIADLARACGLPVQALEATVSAFNRAAAAGEDADFGRGRSAYNRVQGWPEQKPNPALGPLVKGPFHAVRILPGNLGTFAGLETDAAGRVLTRDGTPVPGLHAVGNDMNSIFGGHYPSGGITLGPAMTFGYVIGRFLAGQPLPAADSIEKEKT